MSKNSLEFVKHNIQELAIGNYNSYPQDYDPANQETSSNIRSLAKGYWDVRDTKEIERDEKLNIHLEDYVEWSREAYQEFIAQDANAVN